MIQSRRYTPRALRVGSRRGSLSPVPVQAKVVDRRCLGKWLWTRALRHARVTLARRCQASPPVLEREVRQLQRLGRMEWRRSRRSSRQCLIPRLTLVSRRDRLSRRVIPVQEVQVGARGIVSRMLRGGLSLRASTMRPMHWRSSQRPLPTPMTSRRRRKRVNRESVNVLRGPIIDVDRYQSSSSSSEEYSTKGSWNFL